MRTTIRMVVNMTWLSASHEPLRIASGSAQRAPNAVPARSAGAPVRERRPVRY